jgi:hypothetical protein
MNDKQKEVYRRALLPTGTVAEVFMRSIHERAAPQKQARYIGNMVWEPLHRASVYILTQEDRLDELTAALKEYRETLVQWILDLPSRGNSYGRRPELFIRGSFAPELLASNLQNATLRVHHAIGFDKARAALWDKEHQHSPSLLAGSRWRTFSRNLEPAVSATILDFPEPLRTAATRLPTRVGFESATTLWQRCFMAPAKETEPSRAVTVAIEPQPEQKIAAEDSMVPPVETAKPGDAPVWTSDALPLYIQVTVLRDGMVSLSTQFNPSAQVAIRESITKKLPTKMRKRFAPREHTVLCSFRIMAASVDALVLWRREEEEAARTLAADYETWVQGILNEDLMARLGKTFTRQELPQLMAVMEKKGIKSA